MCSSTHHSSSAACWPVKPQSLKLAISILLLLPLSRSYLDISLLSQIMGQAPVLTYPIPHPPYWNLRFRGHQVFATRHLPPPSTPPNTPRTL
ncbi:hypothetical protein BKA62DRAFT_827704 [Auriculariales sp. MPI-PUGE-AT-0066]|nr:hypothetical protein BKA62DRAFT_827704 [Auriculariales sp. MPI-PUGE-AT-0066]